MLWFLYLLLYLHDSSVFLLPDYLASKAMLVSSQFKQLLFHVAFLFLPPSLSIFLLRYLFYRGL
jgi:hypothetical protein